MAGRASVLQAVGIAVVAITTCVGSAWAASVQSACKSDYYAHCSSHIPYSAGMRSCMRAAGPKLSKGCIEALISAGEVSRSEVKRRAADNR